MVGKNGCKNDSIVEVHRIVQQKDNPSLHRHQLQINCRGRQSLGEAGTRQTATVAK